MPFIVNEIEHFERNVLAQDVGMLQVFTLSNILAVQSKRAGSAVYNFFAKNFFDKNEIVTETIEEKLEKEINLLMSNGKDKLIEMLVDKVTERADVFSFSSSNKFIGSHVNSDSSSGNRSIWNTIKYNEVYAEHWEKDVIDFISRYKNLDLDLPYRQRADEIVRLVMKDFFKQAQEKVKNQSAKEQKRTEEELDRILKDLPEDQREALKENFDIDKLSGKAVRNIIVSVGPAVIVGAGGFSSYIALTTLMHLVFTTMLNITLPFAVYTTATSFMSVLLGPVGFFAFGAFGVWKSIKDNRKLSATLLSFILMQVYTQRRKPFMPPEEYLTGWVSERNTAQNLKVNTRIGSSKVITINGQLEIDEEAWEETFQKAEEIAKVKYEILRKKLEEEYKEKLAYMVSADEVDNMKASYEVKLDKLESAHKKENNSLKESYQRSYDEQKKIISEQNKRIQSMTDEKERLEQSMRFSEARNIKFEEENNRLTIENNRNQEELRNVSANLEKEQAKNKKLEAQLEQLYVEKIEQDEELKNWKDEFRKVVNKTGVEANFESLDEWRAYEKLALTKLSELSNQEVSQNPQVKQRYDKLLKIFKKHYKNLDEKEIALLVTGEILFNSHKDNKDLDFSVILLSYAKCFESVMRTYLYNNNAIRPSDKKTLGDLIKCAKEYLKNDKKTINNMYKFLDIRNEAAHSTDGLDKDELIKARGLLFDLKGKNEKKYLLDYMYSKLYVF